MNWDEWMKAYPALQAIRKPEDTTETFTSRLEAEHCCKLLELQDEMVYKVVEYQDVFYIVTRDEAEVLCPGQLD